VVEHGQRERLEHHALRERPGDGQDRRARGVDLTLRVAVDVAAEAIVGQPVERPVVDHRTAAQRLELGFAEAKGLERI
jgi:hypothetical protein